MTRRTSRRLQLLLVAMAITLSGVACGGGDSAEIARLEQRIEELETEAPTTTVRLTSTTLGITTSTTSTSTTTTVPTTTTTTQEAWDWEMVTLDDVVAWWEADDMPDPAVRAFTSTCEGGRDGLQAITTLLGEEAIPMLELASAAERGEVPVSEAVSAFENFGDALGLLYRLAKITAESARMGDLAVYAKEIELAANDLVLPIITIPITVFDAEANTFDAEAFQLWGAGLDEKLANLITLGYDFAADQYCA